MIRSAGTDAVEELLRLSQATADEDPLKALAAANALRRRAERLEAVQVRRARAHGLPWTRIAEALGVSKQAVHKKYGGRRGER
ncbi:MULTISPECIES: hypothetical protein [Thermomonospora]|uniref:Uncharacterized protein n=1 Tax=Thermomonospora curvata (strain ATCC 19995 / DSM 43183 / JCM 3096 / KCTC 9072 / NBRC 15933 / NCIMB 10081 / Henssen B9) TaxID=471852 RepID=D1AC92_THECD|nr:MULTISPECIES: hypothetical protein [Thermomonospora]ACY97358.1 hypothetical protein Tcur_1784 [Thermomonospora curvata DSM 43183]PKK14718.1 MAG: hypothetical protein BUE48_008785 [Thermomonospora sp. CIF 1]